MEAYARAQRLAEEVLSLIADVCYESQVMHLQVKKPIEVAVKPKTAMDPLGNLLPQETELDIRLSELCDDGTITGLERVDGIQWTFMHHRSQTRVTLVAV